MTGYISKELRKNIRHFNNILGVDKNFDIMYRVVQIGGKEALLYFIDGFIKDEIIEKLLEFFYKIKESEMPTTPYEMLKNHMPYMEIDLLDKEEDIVINILSGVPCLFIDGYEKCMAIDCRSYPMRSVEEPEKDKTMRGSRDGFVETLVYNTALIRRRIRNPQLRMEILSIGESSKTDIVITYMEDRVDPKLRDDIVERIKKIKIDALTFNQESLAECLLHSSWFNPFPKFKYAERPDTTAAALLEGSLAILVDNSPAAMILPTTIFDIVEEADDYYFPPITGSYLRISRFVINVLAVFLTPLFLLLMQNPEYIPKGMEFIMTKETVYIPLIWQFLILEFALDGLRLASINTPSMLSTPLSVAAGLIIGDFTVSSGWFNAEAMLYEAFVAIGTYTQASYELGYALKFMRIITLILTSIFGIYGFIAGGAIAIFTICFTKTVHGKSYIYPLIPFNGASLFRRFFRRTLPQSESHRRKNYW